MKFISSLFLIPVLSFTTILRAEGQSSFAGATILFKMQNHYRFEMDVLENTSDKLILKSSKVFKKHSYSFEPSDNTREDNPYIKFNYSHTTEESEDPSSSLDMSLKDFTTSNGTYWFPKSNLNFSEKYVPYSNPATIVNANLKKRGNVAQETRDLILKNVIHSSTEYVFSEAFNGGYEEDVQSKFFDKKFVTRNHFNRSEMSQNLNIEAQNFSFYADEMSSNRLNARAVDSFNLGFSYSFAEKIYNSLIRYNNLNYAYLMLHLTSVLPIGLDRYDDVNSTWEQERASKWPPFKMVKDSNNNTGLFCYRKSKRKFSCNFIIEFNIAFNMPNSDQIRKYLFYPGFVSRYLKKRFQTNNNFEQESKNIDLNSLEHFKNN